MTLNSERILDLWEEGWTSRRIAEAMFIHNGTVCNVILRARDRGDPRAKRRRR